MMTKARERREKDAGPSVKQRARQAVQAAAGVIAQVPVVAPKPQPNRPVPAPPPEMEVQPAPTAPTAPAAASGGNLLAQLKGAYGMAMGMGGVVVIICAFAVGRMYGPKTTQAAEPERMVVQAQPAPVVAPPAAPAPKPAAPIAKAAAVREAPAQATAKDPWAALMKGAQEAGQ